MPSSIPLDIGVIGCGTAGGAIALFLARAGHRVSVYERVPEPGPVGSGILIQPTGLAVLARLGLDGDILARGSRVERLHCVTRSGRKVIDIAYAALAPSLFGCGLHRGVLFDALFRAVKRERIALHLGVAVEDLAAAPGGGRYVVDADGKRHGPHELIVVADGARSHLRDDTTFKKRVAEYRWGALWYIGPDDERRFDGRLHQVVHTTRRLLGFLPTGVGPGENARRPLVSLFWSIRRDRHDEWKRDGLDAWKREVLSLAPEADAFLARIERPEQLQFTTYLDVRMPRWSTDDVVYLGDAAHAMSPQLGQGANLALFDAMVLADCLLAHDSVAAALGDYTRQRRRHLGYYALATRWLTPFFQSDYLPLGVLRDALMGPISRLPFIGREMVRSMAGMKLGLLRGSLALPAPAPALPPASTMD